MSHHKTKKQHQTASKPTAVTIIPSRQKFWRGLLITAGCGLVVAIAAIIVWRTWFTPEKPLRTTGLNLLVITLDTVRADRLGVYGYKTAATPNLDRLARQGVMFENCFSPVPLTLAAHSSIFTGKYPLGHHVRGNGSYALPEQEITLAERMKDIGYNTFGVISSFVLLAKFGLQQGFDLYDDSLNSHKMYNNYTSEITAPDVYNKFLQWFVKQDQKPFFAWIHLYDAHEPYAPPRKFIDRFGKSPSNRYDGEIAFVDEAVGKIIEALEKKNVLDNTLIVIMGDHGEAFGEHLEYGHGIFCYDETLKVPLIFYNRQALPKKGLRVKNRVNLVDIYPTLLELFGMEPQRSVQGKSLAGFLAGQEENELRNFYFESMYSQDEMNWAAPMGIIDGNYKYINLPEPELYDLQNDAAEKDNLFWKKNALAKDLDKKLAQQVAILSKGGVAADARRDLTAEDKAQLTTLGYISSFANKASSLLDPKKGIILDNKIKHVFSLLEAGKLAQAETALTALMAETPGNKMQVYFDLLQQLYAKQKRTDKVIETLKEAIQAYPNIERFYILYAFEIFNQDRIVETEEVCRKLLKLNPNFTRAYILLGEIEEKRGDVVKALAFYKKALAIEPQNISLKIKLAELLIMQKLYPDALALYDQLLDRQEVSANADFLFKVAIFNFQQGLLDKSEPLFNRAITLAPNGRYYFSYAMALSKNNKLSQALTNMEIALEKYPADLTPQQHQLAQKAIAFWRSSLNQGN